MRTDPEAHKAYARDWHAKRRDWVKEYKSTHPCVDCGKQYPWYVMQFDHVRGVKSNNVAGMSAGSREKLIAEIAKCDIVCANCHSERTHSRRMAR